VRNNYLTRRKRLGMTREELAALSGVSISTIIRAEQHKNVIRPIVQAIEAALAIREVEQKTEAAS
jgi:transcriptional regulator with XRE-family HTH domain